MELSENNNDTKLSILKMDYRDDYTRQSSAILEAKPSMLGNRRKQSKPSRIHEQSNDMTKSLPDTETRRSSFDCDQCSVSYDVYEDLAWHQYEMHGLIKLNKSSPDSQSQEMITDCADMETEQEDLRPELADEREPGEVDKKPGVFHQDTHCQICDRVFCNKYFLQSHLSNKHNIYKEVPRSPIIMPKDDPMDLTSNCPEKIEEDIKKSSPEPMITSSVISTPNFTAGLSIPSLAGQNFYPKLPDPYLKLPSSLRPPIDHYPKQSENFPKLPDNYPKLADNFPKYSEGYKFVPSQPEADKNKRGVEDFCELCQKHFCNKYYLRKHKMDVHGIHSDPYSVRRRLGLSSNERRETPAFTNASIIPQPSPAPMLMMSPFAPMMTLPPDPMLFQRYSLPGMMGVNLGKEENVEKKDETKEKEDRRTESKEDKVKPTEDVKPFSHTHFIDELMSKYDKNADRRERHPGSSDESRSDEDISAKVSPKLRAVDEENRNEMEKEKPAPDHPRTCDICLKVFADKYSLRMHKINIHDMQPNKEKPPKTEPVAPYVPDLNLRYPPVPIPSTIGPIPSTLTMTPSPPDYDVLASMYGSMTAAKLADRVACDICNKDVCNKYFLKTHKVKMHGVDPATLLDSPQKDENTAPEPNVPTSRPISYPPVGSIIPGLQSVPSFPFTSNQESTEAENARREELLKFGIDPESYCEICRKEFCSKYFLRTHKLNMHGIPTDKPGNRKEDREISRREILQRELMMQHQNFGQIPLDFSMINADSRPSSLTPFLPTSPFKPSVKKEFDSESIDSNKSDKSGKSKDPANSIRVKCELCNKELCNKYFLRTHKMKKHGIVDDVLSEGQQRKLLELQKQGMFPVINYGNYPKTDEKDGKSGDESPSIANGGDFSTLCQICDESFPSLDLLHIHMFMSHGNGGKDTSVCQICGLLCKDVIGLQLHMVQEHNATINITPEQDKSPEPSRSPDTGLDNSTPVISRNPELFNFLSRRHLNYMTASTKSDNSDLQSSPTIEHKKKLFSCSKCPFKTRVSNHLHAHQKLKHRNESSACVSVVKFRCRNCRKRFINRKSLRLHHLKCRHRKCPNCNFSSDIKDLKLHMLVNHPHSPNAVENYGVIENGRIDHADEKFVMQKFSIADKADANFANAFVYLPVAEKVERPITVSLHLTPTDR